MHTHTHDTHTNIIKTIHSTYLISPVESHVPWPDWYLSLRAPATSHTETWTLGSVRAPLVPKTGPARHSQCQAARSWCTLGPRGSALPPGGGKVPKGDEICENLSIKISHKKTLNHLLKPDVTSKGHIIVLVFSNCLTLSLCRFLAVTPETRQCCCCVEKSHGGLLPILLGVHRSPLFQFLFIVSTCICGAQWATV